MTKHANPCTRKISNDLSWKLGDITRSAWIVSGSWHMRRKASSCPQESCRKVYTSVLCLTLTPFAPKMMTSATRKAPRQSLNLREKIDWLRLFSYQRVPLAFQDQILTQQLPQLNSGQQNLRKSSPCLKLSNKSWLIRTMRQNRSLRTSSRPTMRMSFLA